jgi:SAM-dependent methyltransferase
MRLYGRAGDVARHLCQMGETVGLEVTIALERSGAWRGAATPRSRRETHGEPGQLRRPVRLITLEGVILARPSRLPLPTASVTHITCRDVIEYIANEDLTLDEFARVLSPGGTLRLTVPATGPLAGLDAYNLMHYLVDTGRRGLRPFEIAEVGWRRHYGIDDLEDMLGADRFVIQNARRRGLAISELTDFSAMVLFRWLRMQPEREQSVRSLARRIRRAESHLVTPIGYYLEVEARRRS